MNNDYHTRVIYASMIGNPDQEYTRIVPQDDDNNNRAFASIFDTDARSFSFPGQGESALGSWHAKILALSLQYVDLVA